MKGLLEIKAENAKPKPRRHPTRAELIDLTDHIGIDEFDQVLRAIDHVLDNATSLALDDAGDRAELRERLTVALGKVPERPVRRGD